MSASHFTTLSAPAVAQAIYTALNRKTYRGQAIVNPTQIAAFALRVQERIQRSINEAVQDSDDGSVNWQFEVFKPIIADFEVSEMLGFSIDDTEYLLLLTTVALLGYELLLRPETSGEKATGEFLINIFSQYFTEMEMRMGVGRRLRSEQYRLEHSGGTDFLVLQALRTMLKLMPDHSTASASAAEDSITSVTPSRATDSAQSGTPADTAQVLPRASQPCTLRAPTPVAPGQVKIEVYLKSGHSWPFDFVDSMGSQDRRLVMQSYVGSHMAVEPGFTVSNVAGLFDTVNIKALHGSPGTLAATILLPPGYSFHVLDIEDINCSTNPKCETRIDTHRATLVIKSGEYVIKRRNCRASALIETCE